LETIQSRDERNEMESIIQELEKQEQLNSLHYLVQKLPDFVKAIQAMEGQLSFIRSTLEDRSSLKNIVEDCENSWKSLHLSNEHAESLIKLVKLLPRLVPLLEKLEEMMLFVQNVWQDKQSVEYLANSLKDVVPVQRGLEILQETNERFALQREENINILRMYRLLKDPLIQKGFRYIETLLDVIKTNK
jgi:uncharacterized protein YjgD (DUF1641 family)